MKSKFYIKSVLIVSCLFWMVSAFPQVVGVWERLEDMPQAASWYGSCFDAASEKIYIFGGQPPDPILTLLATTQIFDIKTETWSLGAPMLNPTGSLSTEIINGKIYTIGEYIDPAALNNVRVYDPDEDSWETKGPLPDIFFSHGSCVYNDSIYVFGGWDENYSALSTAWVYDPVSDKWEALPEMPDARMKPSVCVFNNMIYLFGDFVGDITALKYDPAKKDWTEIAGAPEDVWGGALPIVHKDSILLFGGMLDGDYPPPSSAIYAFHPQTNTFQKYNDMPFARWAEGYKIGDYVYMFGGLYAASIGSASNEVWRFDLSKLGPHFDIDTTTINTELYSRQGFIFSHNYPNPFTGSTTISYQLFEPGFVQLEIYNILGKKVATLVKEQKEMGEYQIEWNARGFSPGVYFSIFNDGKTQQAIKMLISN